MPACNRMRLATAVAWMTVVLCCRGCGKPDHPTVSGKVTLDGRPLASAMVSYMPSNRDASPAFVNTDASGQYAFDKNSSAEAVAEGSYEVRISTFQAAIPDIDPPVPAVKEVVPTRYNVNTELTAEVGAGENVFDFELQSQGGRVLQPAGAID